MAQLTLNSSFIAHVGTEHVRELKLVVAVTISGPLERDFVAGADDVEIKAELRRQLAPLEGSYLDDIVGRATLENIAAYLLVRLSRLRPYSVQVLNDNESAIVYGSDIDRSTFEGELLFKRATSLALRGQWARALAVYSDAIALGPTAKTLNARGRCRRRLGDMVGAIDDFTQAMNADAGFAEAYRNRGNVLLEVKRNDEALRDLSVAVEMMPHSALAWNNRGYALLCMGRPAEALADHCRAIELDPNYEEAYRDKIAALEALGRNGETQIDRAMIAVLTRRTNPTTIERGKLEGCPATHSQRFPSNQPRILLITPDYISHYLPMATIGDEWRRRGGCVWVATGDNLQSKVKADGFNYVRLLLGEGGIRDFMRTSKMSTEELSKLEESLRATAGGMLAAFNFQASHRESALLWHVEAVFTRLGEIIAAIRPDFILSVQLASNATAALLAHNATFATLVTGHYAQIPVDDEVYGVPYLRPGRFSIPPEKFAELEASCRRIQDGFTVKFNEFVQKHRPGIPALHNALRVGSPILTLHNYPAEFASANVVASTRVHFVGPIVRCEAVDCEFARWHAESDTSRPLVVISLGSFFAVRADLLRRIAAAFASTECRVAMAVGENGVSGWELPKEWYVAPFLHQRAIMQFASLVVFHGGNNTFLEALTAGVAMLVGPLCSDEFAIAADVERLGLGFAFDPNGSPAEEIRSLALKALGARVRAAELAVRVCKPGGALACDLMARFLTTKNA